MLQQFDERNRQILINIDGDLLPRDQAKVSVFDSLVQGGDGCWEGLRLYEGRIFKLAEHLERLRHSALAMGFETIPSAQAMEQEIQRTLQANGMYDGVHIRLTLSRGIKITSGMDPRLNQSGPTLIVLAEFKAPVYSKNGLTLASSSLRRFPADCLDPKIHHNNLLQSILAKLEANAAGADDALMLDTRGFVAETNATHMFLVAKNHQGETWVETSRTVACPEGITRATVLEICQAHGIRHAERDLTQAELYRAEEVFCTGTMGELAGVTRIDGRTIGAGVPGPVTQTLSAWYRERTALEGTRVVPESAR
ncbi:MAG: aminotransferase class IV [Planctomycetes bacterium]|mgnify:CR=1 FL=1|nr:aminotransferase class IV [Planctomycetota bacterium]HPF14948.1 aminotransferase class IV [Planctomycetota bacterium]HRV80290.1 aminotransferase class IV [Planctomycetota bacterium]